jgi:HAD superfamily hydrolase (TIGR01450 family)
VTRSGTWVIDLDGVIWLAGEPIGGAARGVRRLHAAGIRPLFVTNNSSPTVEELQARMRHCDISAPPGDIISSADAAATMLDPRSSALVLADGGVVEALQARNITIDPDTAADAVVVGFTRQFDFDRLARAASAVRAGARLIGTNEDANLPTPDGLVPGAGSLLAAVCVASGARPEVAGKPHRPIVDVVRARAADVTLVVGDRPSTDGTLARRLGVPFALVLSGVTSEGGDYGKPAPDFVAADLGALVDQILAV